MEHTTQYGTVKENFKTTNDPTKIRKRFVNSIFLAIFVVYEQIVFKTTKLLMEYNLIFMRTIALQYVTDDLGNKDAVLLKYSDWKRITKDLDELDQLRNKQTFFLGLKEAFEEVKLIKKGEKQSNSFKALINELRNNPNG